MEALNSRDRIPESEWRRVCDLRLFGFTNAEIAARINRSLDSVKSLFSKIRRNYDEEGKRETPIRKIRNTKSFLDYNRALTIADIEWGTDLANEGRTDEEIALLLNVPESIAATVKTKDIHGRKGLFS